MSPADGDLFAVTLDGRVYLNARALERSDLRELATTKGVFIGVLLSHRELRLLGDTLRDASAEAAARLGGARWKKDKKGRK